MVIFRVCEATVPGMACTSMSLAILSAARSVNVLPSSSTVSTSFKVLTLFNLKHRCPSSLIFSLNFSLSRLVLSSPSNGGSSHTFTCVIVSLVIFLTISCILLASSLAGVPLLISVPPNRMTIWSAAISSLTSCSDSSLF